MDSKGGNNKSSSSSKQKKKKEVSRSYTPISYYKADSVIKHPGPVIKGNYVPLSLYKTTVVYQPDESKMDIYLSSPPSSSSSNEEASANLQLFRKYRPISFLFEMDPSVSIPGVRINYHTPLPSSSVLSQSNVIFTCFASSQSKSLVNVSFDSFGCHSSELSKQQQQQQVCTSRNSSIPDKLFITPTKSSSQPFSCYEDSSSSESKSSKWSSESKSDSEHSIFGSSESSQSKSDSDSDQHRIFGSSQSKSESKVIFSCFGSSQSSKSKSVAAAANVSFGSFGSSQSSLSKFINSFKSKVRGRNSSIPDELAFSILLNLSIKPLKRFGCVRKSWSILFEDTHFMTLYTKHFISRHGSHHDYHTFIHLNHTAHRTARRQLHHSEFHLLKNRLQLNLPYPLQCSTYGTCILGSTSVNGIFCIGQDFPCMSMTPNSRYALCNPLTNEFMEVPPSPAQLTPEDPDPESGMYIQHTFHGFGYDKLRDDFKIIQYVSFNDTYVFDCYSLPTSFFEIYSLKSNSWTMIHMDKDLCHTRYDFSNSKAFNGHEVYLDGACHWLVLGPVIDLDVITGLTLLSFDLSDEVFITTPIGEEPYSPRFPRHRLTALNGSIALISNHHDDIVFHISILGELGVSESWTKLYIYGPLPSIKLPPIGFGKMGYMFVKKKNCEVAYVDLSTQIIEEVGIIADRMHSIVGLYKESLQRIK